MNTSFLRTQFFFTGTILPKFFLNPNLFWILNFVGCKCFLSTNFFLNQDLFWTQNFYGHCCFLAKWTCLWLGLTSTLTWDDKLAKFPIIHKLGKKYSITFWCALGMFAYNISTNEVIFPQKSLFCFINGVLFLLSEKT